MVYKFSGLSCNLGRDLGVPGGMREMGGPTKRGRKAVLISALSVLAVECRVPTATALPDQTRQDQTRHALPPRLPELPPPISPFQFSVSTSTSTSMPCPCRHRLGRRRQVVPACEMQRSRCSCSKQDQFGLPAAIPMQEASP